MNGEPVVYDQVYTVTANYMVAMIAQTFMGLHFESFELPGMTEYDAVRRLGASA